MIWRTNISRYFFFKFTNISLQNIVLLVMHFKHIKPRLKLPYSNTFYTLHFRDFFPIFLKSMPYFVSGRLWLERQISIIILHYMNTQFHAHTHFKRSPSTTDPSSNDEKKSCNSKTVKRNKLHLSSGKHIKFLQ